MLNDSEYNVYNLPKSGFTVSNDLVLRLNLDHSKNEYSFLKLKEASIISYIHRFKGKLSRKALGIIIGLLLRENDEPEKFRAPFKKAAGVIEKLNFLEMSKEEFEANLNDIYIEHLETLTDVLNSNALKESIINRTKDMLSGGKKQRKIAQELLQKIENNDHVKISDYYKKAENALKKEDYEKAAKNFNKAALIAEELIEKDLAKTLREKARLSQKIPTSTKTLEKVVHDAINALRNDDFHSAYIFYKRASDISKELMLSGKEEEYRLKSKALSDFYQVDQKFKKKN